MRRLALILALAPLLACSQPIQRATYDESFLAREAGRARWRRVAVLPLSGLPENRRTAAEWLAHRVRGLGLFEIVDPGLAEIDLAPAGIVVGQDNLAAVDAQRAGRALSADGVLFGSTVRGPAGAMPFLPIVSASLLDTATGRVVASASRSGCGWNVGPPECLPVSIDNVVQDLAPALRAAAGMPWVPPPPPPAEPAGPPGEIR